MRAAPHDWGDFGPFWFASTLGGGTPRAAPARAEPCRSASPASRRTSPTGRSRSSTSARRASSASSGVRRRGGAARRARGRPSRGRGGARRRARRFNRRFNGNGRRRCRYSMPFRWLTKPVWKMKTHFNELFNVYKDERIDLKTVRLSRKLGARRRRPADGGFSLLRRRLSSQAARSSRTSGRAASTSRTATSSRSRPATARSARTSTRWSASPSRWATASTGSAAAAARGRKRLAAGRTARPGGCWGLGRGAARRGGRRRVAIRAAD